MCKVAIQCSEHRRVQYLSEVLPFKPEMLVFMDETGSDRCNTIQQYGYQLRGITPVDYIVCLYQVGVSRLLASCQLGN